MGITAEDTLELSVEERIKLVTDIWGSIAQTPERIVLADQTKALLTKRLKRFNEDRSTGTPWSEVRKRLTSK